MLDGWEVRSYMIIPSLLARTNKPYITKEFYFVLASSVAPMRYPSNACHMCMKCTSCIHLGL